MNNVDGWRWDACPACRGYDLERQWCLVCGRQGLVERETRSVKEDKTLEGEVVRSPAGELMAQEPGVIEKIRAKQAAKPKHSPLPGAVVEY